MDDPSRSNHHKTCRRYDLPGHAHALTFSCFNRLPFFRSDRACGWMAESIRRAREKHAFDLWAWVIMPEHVHLLLQPRKFEYSISAILKTIKQSVSNVAIWHVKAHRPDFIQRMTHILPDGSKSVHFWQRGGGYDRNLWSPKYVWEMIDYIHANPVRRLLADNQFTWRWSSAITFEDSTRGEIDLNLNSLPDDPRK
ncbi:MAG: transposase [Phycisphaerales bacterium]|nr:transposase [Phycisphaerales bacterium]MCB9856482.1 transposase [Phycisphaerales bacterium]MCB9863963.1 transposase [Phycisphaerales bacterium]